MAMKVQCATCQATYNLAKPPIKKTVAICKKCGERMTIDPPGEANKTFSSKSSATKAGPKLNGRQSVKGSSRVYAAQISGDESKKKVKKGGFFSRASKGIVSEKEISRDWRKILGILFTIFAIICGTLWYVKPTWASFLQKITFWGHLDWLDTRFSTQLDFKFPGFINSLWGLALCFPIYLRGFVPFKKLSPYSYISFALNLLLFSVIAQLIFGPSGSFIHNTMNTLFVASLVVSWIGMRSIAGFGWLIVFFLALINLIGADYRLKHFGFFFILFAFSSLIFQTNLSPKNFFNNIITEFKGFGDGPGSFVKGAMADAAKISGDALRTGIKTGAKIAIGQL